EILKENNFTPETFRKYPGVQQSRDFVKHWREENVTFDAHKTLQEHAVGPQPKIQTPAPATAVSASAAPALITSLHGHRSKKVVESPQAIIIDDFLPEDVYQRIYQFTLKADYERINAQGKVARAWHLQDGFPLRSVANMFYYAENAKKPDLPYIYP